VKRLGLKVRVALKPALGWVADVLTSDESHWRRLDLGQLLTGQPSVVPGVPAESLDGPLLARTLAAAVTELASTPGSESLSSAALLPPPSARDPAAASWRRFDPADARTYVVAVGSWSNPDHCAIRRLRIDRMFTTGGVMAWQCWTIIRSAAVWARRSDLVAVLAKGGDRHRPERHGTLECDSGAKRPPSTDTLAVHRSNCSPPLSSGTSGSAKILAKALLTFFSGTPLRTSRSTRTSAADAGR
jgi:hypothetical protein